MERFKQNLSEHYKNCSDFRKHVLIEYDVFLYTFKCEDKKYFILPNDIDFLISKVGNPIAFHHEMYQTLINADVAEEVSIKEIEGEYKSEERALFSFSELDSHLGVLYWHYFNCCVFLSQLEKEMINSLFCENDKSSLRCSPTLELSGPTNVRGEYTFLPSTYSAYQFYLNSDYSIVKSKTRVRDPYYVDKDHEKWVHKLREAGVTSYIPPSNKVRWIDNFMISNGNSRKVHQIIHYEFTNYGIFYTDLVRGFYCLPYHSSHSFNLNPSLNLYCINKEMYLKIQDFLLDVPILSMIELPVAHETIKVFKAVTDKGSLVYMAKEGVGYFTVDRSVIELLQNYKIDEAFSVLKQRSEQFSHLTVPESDSSDYIESEEISQISLGNDGLDENMDNNKMLSLEQIREMGLDTDGGIEIPTVKVGGTLPNNYHSKNKAIKCDKNNSATIHKVKAFQSEKNVHELEKRYANLNDSETYKNTDFEKFLSELSMPLFYKELVQETPVSEIFKTEELSTFEQFFSENK